MAHILDDTYEGLKIAGLAVRSHPLRSALTMLGIVIGIVTVTLMGAFLIGINEMFKSTVSFMGSDVYYIDKFDWAGKNNWMLARNRPNISIEEAELLRQRLTTAKAVSVSTNQWQMEAKSRTETVSSMTAVGVDEPYLITSSIDIEQGRFLSTAELLAARPVCIIGHELADKLFPNGGAVGQQIRVGSYPLQIVGVAKKVGGFFGAFTLDNQALMPLRTFFSAYGEPHRSVTIAIKAKNPLQRQDTRDEVEHVYRQIRGQKPNEDRNFGLNSQDQFNQQIDQLSATLNIVGFLITGLSLLVGGIGIMNIMFVTVRERTKEIGVRKAIGAKRRSILVQFLAEASMLSMFAGVLALAIAYPLSILLDTQLLSNSPIRVGFPMSVAMTGLILSVAVGLLSGFIPAWKASKLNPVDALRYE